MREAYRLNAQPLLDFCQTNRCSFLVAFNYMDKELRSQAEVTKAMQKALAKLTATPPTRTTDKGAISCSTPSMRIEVIA